MIEKAIGRRTALRAFMSLVPSMTLLKNDPSIMPQPPYLEPPQGRKESARFTNFDDWYNYAGKEYIDHQARVITGFDPDLVSMNSFSLSTRVRVQRRRNHDKLMIERKKWFWRSLGLQKFVEWWP